MINFQQTIGPSQALMRQKILVITHFCPKIIAHRWVNVLHNVVLLKVIFYIIKLILISLKNIFGQNNK